MKKSKNLNIGDKLYRATTIGFRAGVLYYDVIEIRQQKECTQYLIECENCTHRGDNCRVLVADAGNNNFRFVAMANNDGYYESDDGDENYSFSDDHTSYNDTSDGVFFSTTKKATLSQYLEKGIKWRKDQIEKEKKNIEEHEKAIAECKALLEGMTE